MNGGVLTLVAGRSFFSPSASSSSEDSESSGCFAGDDAAFPSPSSSSISDSEPSGCSSSSDSSCLRFLAVRARLAGYHHQYRSNHAAVTKMTDFADPFAFGPDAFRLTVGWRGARCFFSWECVRG